MLHTQYSRCCINAEALDNGECTSPKICHYCVQSTRVPCCRSRAESMRKLYFSYERRFGSGYDPPLLYRFKHTVPANQFFQDGMLLHEILPRVLRAMANLERSAADSVVNAVNAPDEEDVDPNLAEVNQKRQQKVIQAMASPSFSADVFAIRSLAQPINELIAELSHRTTILSKLNDDFALSDSDGVGLRKMSLSA